MKACFVSSNSGNVTVEVETYDGTAIGELRGLCMHNIMYIYIPSYRRSGNFRVENISCVRVYIFVL